VDGGDGVCGDVREAAVRILSEEGEFAGLEDAGNESGKVGGLFLGEA
jgi:hypothetical protein